MSFMLEILRCILCCEEEEYRGNREDETWDTNPFLENRHHNTIVGTSAPSHYHPVSQSDSDTTTHNYGNSSPTNTIIRPSKLPETSTIPSIQPLDSGINVKSSISTRHQRTLEKSQEVPQKPKSSAPSRPSPSPSPSPSSSKSVPSSSKPTLSPAPTNPINQQTKANYVWVEKGTSPIYVIPEYIKDMVKEDIVPGVLKNPLSPSTYMDYFAALLYAEDFYIEKWSKFQLENVTLKLHEAVIYNKSKKKNLNERDEKDDKIFVAFEIDSVRERRPFLLSRDFVFVRPSGKKVEPFQGIIYRVVKSTLVLVEFGDDFHRQHYSGHKYDVSFSFNRVCLKRSHQAVAAASDPLFRNFLFPDCVSRNSLLTSPSHLSFHCPLHLDEVSAIHHILSLKGPPPYLVEGPLSVEKRVEKLSRTGLFVQEAILQIYRIYPKCRILVCAPINSTCDVLMRSLKKEIPESDMFRANAAFRELDGVPFDILPSCLYKGECFACPSVQELRNYKVILSTFVSSFRLHNEGIVAGHFSHIFVLDASSATEPETMVALANLANEKTAVILTGAPRNHSGWVRSDIARRNGLMISYFERLCESKPYRSLNPMFITRLENTGP